jgi:DNA-binding response OmpR family regulator
MRNMEPGKTGKTLAKVSKNKILVVDDDPQIRREVKSHLERIGYEVHTAEDGHSALKLAQTLSPDMVVLDINFPPEKLGKERAIDGLEVLRWLRDSANIPVLMLSSTNLSSVKVMALSVGADDYVAKPFDLKELGARVEAILRRTRNAMPEDQVLSFRRLRLDPGARRVWKDEQPVELTEVEFEMLYTLARRPDHVFTREKLIELAWKQNSYCVPKVVDVHIGHIRKKIEDDPSHPTFIVTVRGAGYRFEGVTA